MNALFCFVFFLFKDKGDLWNSCLSISLALNYFISFHFSKTFCWVVEKQIKQMLAPVLTYVDFGGKEENIQT